jgi:hypothetical protein
MISPEELAEFLSRSAAMVRPELEADLVKIGEAQKKLAKDMIGHEHADWPPLAESTIEEKARLGYPVPAPLLREEILRDSIEMRPLLVELEVEVGSNDPVALFQEMGTDRGIPPRPFISKSAVDNLPFAEDTLGQTAVALLTPGGNRWR